MDLMAAARAWRRDGFVVLPGFLRAECEEARGELPDIYPTAERFHGDADDRAHSRIRGDEFGGIVVFPFPGLALSRLVVCGKLVSFAEAVFGTSDIRVYAAELWAKYSGAADYEQEHHRDYLNHTPLVPSADLMWRGLEMFIWLHDVPEDRGPTRIVPLAVTAGAPALPHGYERSEWPELYDAEVSAAGSAGTVVAYSTDTFHRGTQLTAPGGARFSAHVSYRHASNEWTSRYAWGDRSFTPHWVPFAEHASPRQLQLFGFPPPGHRYWTAETLAGMAARYPGMDLTAWHHPST
jgi:hypothetical protein